MSNPSPTARFALKAATAQAHERLDRLFSRFNLTNPAGYGDFLLAQAGAFAGVEDALTRAGAAEVIADWPQRRRAKALQADLHDLGLAAPSAVPSPPFTTEAAVLGGVYVLEGSRLGGAVLVRDVPDDLPTRFLRAGTPGAWRAFIAVLDRRLGSDVEIDAAARAATSVFGVFESSARRIAGADQT